ncbi:hypothetical protein MASR2M17_01060 [Aminivibrio sp.]
MTREAAKKLLKNLPDRPGIYLMRDDTGAVIYVGKAKSLKKCIILFPPRFLRLPEAESLWIPSRIFRHPHGI